MSSEEKKGRSGISRPGHVQSPEGGEAAATDRIAPDHLARVLVRGADPMVVQPALTTLSSVTSQPGLVDPDPEATVKCRPQSSLPLFPAFPGGPCIFTDYSAPLAISQDVGITFFLNPRHLILPGVPIPGCTADGMVVVPSLCENVNAVSGPLYVAVGTRIGQILFVVRPADPTRPLKLGFRIKFEEDAAVTGRFNPRKKAGQVAVPKSGTFRIAAATEQAAAEPATATR